MSRLQYLRVLISYDNVPIVRNTGNLFASIFEKLVSKMSGHPKTKMHQRITWTKTSEQDIANWVENFNKN